jgi:hypothetical protein
MNQLGGDYNLIIVIENGRRTKTLLEGGSTHSQVIRE